MDSHLKSPREISKKYIGLLKKWRAAPYTTEDWGRRWLEIEKELEALVTADRKALVEEIDVFMSIWVAADSNIARQWKATRQLLEER